MSSSLVHCIYTSCEAHPLSPTEVEAILRHSRDSLIHVDGAFLQVLEGEPHLIDELYAKILMDPRHTRVTRIILEAIPRRFFGDSTMNLSTLPPEELAVLLDGRDAPKRDALLAGLDEGRAKKLLRAFSDGRWLQTFPRQPENGPSPVAA